MSNRLERELDWTFSLKHFSNPLNSDLVPALSKKRLELTQISHEEIPVPTTAWQKVPSKEDAWYRIGRHL